MNKLIASLAISSGLLAGGVASAQDSASTPQNRTEGAPVAGTAQANDKQTTREARKARKASNGKQKRTPAEKQARKAAKAAKVANRNSTTQNPNATTPQQ